MRVLALDSSGLVASVAVVEGKEGNADACTIAEYTVNYKKTHSQTLLPMLDEVAKMTDLDLASIDAVAVAAGPGSFTGLRIGSATAKGLGLALEKPLIPVPTLEGLAYNLCGVGGLVCPIMDARRGQVYTGIYRFRDGEHLTVVEDQMAVSIEELGEKLKAYKEEVTFLGDGVPVFREVLETQIMKGEKIRFAPANMNRQRAASVGALGLIYYKKERPRRQKSTSRITCGYHRQSGKERSGWNMIQFQCDYTEGAHPKIIERLTRTNLEQTIGYGEDGYCEHARELIRQACQAPEADVQFMVGGTQTNFTVISSILRPYQGVLSAESGHINVHETGAVEATGHKVLTLPSADGKIRASQVREAYEAHWKDGSREHIVQPGMVYISHPTENGTLYTKGELKALYQTCQKLGCLFSWTGQGWDTD